MTFSLLQRLLIFLSEPYSRFGLVLGFGGLFVLAFFLPKIDFNSGEAIQSSVLNILLPGACAAWGLWQVAKGFRRTEQTLALLTNALAVMATRRQVQETLLEINDRTVFELSYVYEIRGLEYTHKLRTAYPRHFGEEELIYIHLATPDMAILAASLPSVIREKMWLQQQ